MKQREAKLSHERLLEILEYFPNTGKFLWKVKIAKNIWIGDEAGCKYRGRFLITINKILYFRSRLAWFYVHGIWPTNEIDHKNQIKDDDRIENLREATRQENGWNRVLPRKYDLPKGIYIKGKKFQVMLQHENKMKYLGYFTNLDDAVKCRDEFEFEYRKFLYE